LGSGGLSASRRLRTAFFRRLSSTAKFAIQLAAPIALLFDLESRGDAAMPEDESESSRKHSPPNRPTVVGVGASAGGVQALRKLFEALPADVGAAFVVVAHLAPDARSQLAELLAARSKLGAVQVTGTSELKANCIYVIPPDRQLRITDHEISAVPFDQPRGHRMPIDYLFRSLAEQHGDGFAVVLTGAGSDDAIGVKAIKEAGGIILVQDPEEAEYPSMPRAAIATEAADFILPIRQLAERLTQLVPAKQQAGRRRRENDDDEILRRILAHLRVRTGHDFSSYKRATVTRRISRRMQVTRRETFDEYFNFLRENAEEAQMLLGDLLISVTTFFRDPGAFQALSRSVVPRLFENRGAAVPIRIWSVGCATGEEAYSLGILLLEEAARHEPRPEIQLFATDMDARALAVAREGRYPTAIEGDVSDDRLRRFFQRDGELYRVKRKLRDLVLFANHSLLKDPPFSHLDLVSCRNLLIYLNRDLQQQAISTLQYALNPEGYLLLGSSESAEHTDGLFHAVDRESRIYQSTGRSTAKLPMLPRLLGLQSFGDRMTAESYTPAPNIRNWRPVHREALEALAPPSLIVDSNHRVLHLSETAGRYLMAPGGPLTSDITEIVREEMKQDLRAALHRAFTDGEAALTPALAVRFNGSAHRVYAQVKPLPTAPGDDMRRALVIFVEGEVVEPIAQTGAAEQTRNETVLQLQRELELAHSRLRTMREESEAANEELRAANEELQSINEEYRSTAEELETSKEGLQSINEELQAVNSELKLKLDTVSRANSDLQNLMAATDFATLFLDPGLHIKRFTPRTTDLFNITQNDIGRPITDFTHQLAYESLAEDARTVLRDLTPIQREVPGRNDGWYLVRARPYRTVDDKIDGIVVTFVEVTDRRRMEESLRAGEQRLRQEMRLVELSRSPIFVWDFDGGILQWNRGSEELYGYSKEEAFGRTKNVLLKTKVALSSFEALKNELLETGTWKGELQQTTKDGRELTVESRIELIRMGDRKYVLESTRDITQAKYWEARQKMLLGELAHRVKNILAVVQGIVHQTWCAGGSHEDFLKRLHGRLTALAKSHDLLVESQWHGADLYGLAEQQLGAYVDGGRVLFRGDPVVLSADVATPFGLVLHELATNAVKYGALSNSEGRVELSWQIERIGERSRLEFAWLERGGPRVNSPTSTGLGTQLVQQGVPGAAVRYQFLPEGVECHINLDLAASGAAGHSDGNP
jgi:two-component system CheB/CheR fusion protein